MERSDIQGILERCELFNGLGRNDVEQIARFCQERNYDSGEYLFRQGDFGEYLYIIAEGHAVLERTIALGTKEGRVSIGVFGRGRVLGCWSTLLGEPHHHMSSALCTKPTHVLMMRGSELRKMMLGNPQFGFTVLERLCVSLKERIQGAYGAMERI